MKYVKRVAFLAVTSTSLMAVLCFLRFYKETYNSFKQRSLKSRNSALDQWKDAQYKDFDIFKKFYREVLEARGEDTSRIVNSFRIRDTTSSTREGSNNLVSESYKTSTTEESDVSKKETPKRKTSETRNVVFLKVHKSASSTVQNIFLRFGFFRNLTFVLAKPPGQFWRNVISLYDTITPHNILPPPRNRTFNILCNHVLYDRAVFQGIMPPDTQYIGILRDPFDQFESTLHYMPPREVFNNKTKGDNPVATYLKNPREHEPKDPRFSLTNNRMSVEYGFPPDLFVTRNMEKTRHHIRTVDEEFDLVLIVELLDESLVLMKRLLNWTLKDILYLASNKRQPKRKRLFNWTPDMRNRFRAWNILDFEMYNFFKSKMLRRIANEGRSLSDEVRYFKHTLRLTEQFCKHRNKSTGNFLTIPKSPWNYKFVIYRHDCWLMGMYEITFIDVLRNLQYPDLARPADDVSIHLVKYFSSILTFHKNNSNLIS